MSVERTFVGLPSPGFGRFGAGGHPCQGVYHTPAGVRPEVAFVASHYNIDFSEHYLADLLAGHRPQLRVPAGAWQSARALGAWTLVGCTVAPGFEFTHFEVIDGEPR